MPPRNIKLYHRGTKCGSGGIHDGNDSGCELPSCMLGRGGAEHNRDCGVGNGDSGGCELLTYIMGDEELRRVVTVVAATVVASFAEAT